MDWTHNLKVIYCDYVSFFTIKLIHDSWSKHDNLLDLVTIDRLNVQEIILFSFSFLSFSFTLPWFFLFTIPYWISYCQWNCFQLKKKKTNVDAARISSPRKLVRGLCQCRVQHQVVKLDLHMLIQRRYQEFLLWLSCRHSRYYRIFLKY